MEVKKFINKLTLKEYDKIKHSSSDGECRRILLEKLKELNDENPKK
jgi:DNA polymerase sigma